MKLPLQKIVKITLLCLLMTSVFLAKAQKQPPQMNASGMVSDIYGVEKIENFTFIGLSKPLLSLNNVESKTLIIEEKEDDEGESRKINPVVNANAQPFGDDPLRQLQSFDRTSRTSSITTIFNFDGTDFSTANVNPPDVNGEVGLSHYVHVSNKNGGSWMKIYNKSTGVLVTSIDTQVAFWSTLGVASLGDPVIIFDQLASRWVYVEIRQQAPAAILMAVSQTNDPTEAWSLYQFATSNTVTFPDFPKISIWNNTIMLTDNESGATSSAPIYAIDRTALYSGAGSVTILRFTVPFIIGVGFQPMVPVDLEGNIAPNSTPIFLRMYDDAWANSGGADHLELWTMNLNWVTPASSTISGPTNLPTAAFSSFLCANFNCTTQPGTAQLLDSQAEYLSFRSQYRNFGAYESIVCTHAVNAGGGVAGVRWYELRRNTGGSWAVFQQSTFSPDAKNRFVSSIGIDASGNIALGYNLTSTIVGNTNFYSSYITGRNISDPLNTMTFTELEFATGTHTMAGGGRTGDYYSMSVDPVDGSTFWFTSHYAKTGTTWGTKIVAFKLSCPVALSPTSAILTNQLASNNIQTLSPNSASTNNSVLYQAGKFVRLNPGFTANPSVGKYFKVQILGCN